MIRLALLIGWLMMIPDLPASAANPEPREALLLTDFTPGGPDLSWYVVNDNVMGGRSEGGFDIQDGDLRFTGRTNTRGGGFSSIRTAPMRLDLSNHQGILLHVKGDGRRYTWRLTTDAQWRGREVSYWAEFATDVGKWSTVKIPFTNFIPKFRGSRLDGPALDPAKISGMGLMIYDGGDGPFDLELTSVHAYVAQTPFSLGEYEWKNRVLVVSATNENDRNMKEQLDELALSPNEFADRDMALVTLLDDSVSRAEDRVLTNGETASARDALGIRPGSFALRLIGKDGSVKFSADSMTPMNRIYALIDTMPMRKAEKDDR